MPGPDAAHGEANTIFREVVGGGNGLESGLNLELLSVVDGTKVVFDRSSLGMRGSEVRDEFRVPVPRLHFSVELSQSSAGTTRTGVYPEEGYSVQALRLDRETGRISWSPPSSDANELVTVSMDGGNMINGASTLRDVGRPGDRSGLIRVSPSHDLSQGKHYVVGARFEGGADGWSVTPAVVQVEFKKPAV